MFRLTVLSVVLGLLSVVAQAAPVRWTLQDVEFDDGATASGYFIVDGYQCGSVDIATTAGPLHRASHYLLEPYHGCGQSYGITFYETTGGSNNLGSGILNLSFFSLETSGGINLPSQGIVSLVSSINTDSSEASCGSGGTPCGQSPPSRMMTQGYLTAAPAPIPAAFWLLGGALGALGVVKRKAKSAA